MILSCGHDYENGSGRRKRCPACARLRHLEQMKELSKTYHRKNYAPKRIGRSAPPSESPPPRF